MRCSISLLAYLRINKVNIKTKKIILKLMLTVILK